MRDGFIGPIRRLTDSRCALYRSALAASEYACSNGVVQGMGASDRVFYDLATDPALLALLAPIVGSVLWGVSIVERDPGEIHAWHTDIRSGSGDASCRFGSDLKTRLGTLPSSSSADRIRSARQFNRCNNSCPSCARRRRIEPKHIASIKEVTIRRDVPVSMTGWLAGLLIAKKSGGWEVAWLRRTIFRYCAIKAQAAFRRYFSFGCFLKNKATSFVRHLRARSLRQRRLLASLFARAVMATGCRPRIPGLRSAAVKNSAGMWIGRIFRHLQRSHIRSSTGIRVGSEGLHPFRGTRDLAALPAAAGNRPRRSGRCGSGGTRASAAGIPSCRVRARTAPRRLVDGGLRRTADRKSHRAL